MNWHAFSMWDLPQFDEDEACSVGRLIALPDYSLPVAVADSQGNVLPWLACFCYSEGGWVKADLIDGPYPEDYDDDSMGRIKYWAYVEFERPQQAEERSA